MGDQGVRGCHLRRPSAASITRPTAPAKRRTSVRPTSPSPKKAGAKSCSPLALLVSDPAGRSRGSRLTRGGLKKRARKATRPLPIPPVLVRLVREHIEAFGTAHDGRLFKAVRGGGLLSKEYGDVWKAARRAVLTEEEVSSPLAGVPYSLRAAGVSLARRRHAPSRSRTPGQPQHRVLFHFLSQGSPSEPGPREPAD